MSYPLNEVERTTTAAGCYGNYITPCYRGKLSHSKIGIYVDGYWGEVSALSMSKHFVNAYTCCLNFKSFRLQVPVHPHKWEIVHDMSHECELLKSEPPLLRAERWAKFLSQLNGGTMRGTGLFDLYHSASWNKTTTKLSWLLTEYSFSVDVSRIVWCDEYRNGNM